MVAFELGPAFSAVNRNPQPKFSPEEKQVLGFTDDFANKVMQNYRTMSSIQNSLGSNTGMAAYL